RTSVQNAGIERVPGCFVAAMPVHNHQSGHAACSLRRKVNNGRNAHAVTSGKGHALGNNALCRRECAKALRRERRKMIFDKERLFDLSPPLMVLSQCSGTSRV